jgi:arylsulfatase A-like enzyme
MAMNSKSVPPIVPVNFTRQALALAVASSAIEVAIRASARGGWSAADLGTLEAAALAVTVLYLAPLAGLARLSRRPYGVLWGGLFGMHAAINYRFEGVLNEFVRDPRVFLGVPAAFVVAALPFVYADRWLSRVHWGALLGSACAAVAIAAARIAPDAGAAPARADQPNVVIISVDTLRPDRLGAYGHAIHTPSIDRLASEGATFEQAIAEAPITEPSHLAMLTGIAPYRSGVVANGTVLGDRPALIWRALAAQGYETAGFVSGFPLHGKYGWGQSTQVWDDDFGAIAGLQSLSLVKLWNQVAVKEHALRERPADLVLARALPWLRGRSDRPYFAFIHFYDVHGPYDAHGGLGPAPTDGTPLNLPFYWPARDRQVTDVAWLEAAYDKEVEHVDDAVGQIVQALGSSLDQTVLILTADHGESFTEHGYLFDHGDNLYDPSLRVPLIVRFPGAVTPGLRVGCQVGGVDVVPTILDILHMDDDVVRDGRSLVAALKGEACESVPVYSSTVAGRMVAVPPVAHSRRLPEEKIIFYSDKSPEYFDLRADPGEATPLENGASRDALDSLVHALQSGGTLLEAAQDSQTLEMLRALGYLNDEAKPTP